MTTTLAMSRLVAPLAVFGAVLAAMVALNGGAASPPALSAGVDIGRADGRPVRDAQRAVRAAPTAPAPTRARRRVSSRARARPAIRPSTRAPSAAFDAALRRDPRELGALIGAGTLAGLRHDFARAAAPRARRRGRAAPGAGPAADGRRRRSDRAGPLRRRGAGRSSGSWTSKPGLASYARVSYFRELSGDAGGAVTAMRLAVSAGGSRRRARAYVQTLLGDLELARGRTDGGARRLPLRPARRPALPPGPHRTRTRRRGERRPRDRPPLASGAPPSCCRSRPRSRCWRRSSWPPGGRGRPRGGPAPSAERAALAARKRRDAAGRRGRAVRGQPRIARACGAAGPARLARGAEHPLRRRARLGAHTRGPAARRPGLGAAGARTGSRDPLFRLHAGVAARRGPGARGRGAFRSR